MQVEASTRVATRNLKGFFPETSIASICSLTFIDPYSAPIFEPIFPAAISAVINGASARMSAMDIKEGSQLVAPNSDRDGRDCLVKTIPVINPVRVMMASDR